MSRDDRDWYREAIRERDSKNKVVQFDKKRKVNKTDYYGAAEPPVRCGESHLSGPTEPLLMFIN